MTDLARLPAPLAAVYDWQLDAACRDADPTMFFHPYNERQRGRARRVQQAKSVCQECPVVAQCRDFALRYREPYGIWGGMSEEERARELGVRSLRYPALTKETPSGAADVRMFG